MDPISIANTAVDKGFQWWFLALLALVLITGIWALRYLLNKAEQDRKAFDAHISRLMDQNAASRDHHHDRVEAMQAEALKVAREVTATVASATKVIESNTRESEQVRRVIERMEAAIK